jgi:acetylglutamate kinase
MDAERRISEQEMMVVPSVEVDAERYVVVLKIGGNELDDESFLYGLANAVKSLQADGKYPVIVHGGGKAIADYQNRLGLETKFVEGLRVTSAEDADLVEMVLSGLMNKRIVRTLLKEGVRAAGISGVDDGTIYVEKMWHPLGDLGRVGEIHDVDLHLINTLLDAGIVPVVSPVSYGSFDALSYNVNADHAAAAIAARIGAIKMIFVSNVPGILIAKRVIRAVTADQAEAWIEEGSIFGGMVPKVRSAVQAVRSGVAQAVITNLAGVQEGTGTGIIGTT